MNSGNVKSFNVRRDIEITVDPDSIADGVVTLLMPEGSMFEGWLLVFLLSQRGVVLDKNKLNTFRVTRDVTGLTLQKGRDEKPVTFAEIREALRKSLQV